MTSEEIIDGLKFTVEMFLLDPSTGETYTEPRNDMDKITIDACKGAIELLEQEPCDDAISRQAAIDALNMADDKGQIHSILDVNDVIKSLPSAQPERTCVNCGRTVNNGGWYADGRTRCPIEEHYALPKDGYCHLWEKRNVTDDDYPERRTDE